MDSHGYRYLLGNMSGNLFMLFLESEKNSKGELAVKDLKVELLGWLNFNFSIDFRSKTTIYIISDGIIFVF